MATQFNACTESGEQRPFGVRFFGGQTRGVTFRFAASPSAFEDCVCFQDESGRCFDRRQVFQEVFSECRTIETPEDEG